MTVSSQLASTPGTSRHLTGNWNAKVEERLERQVGEERVMEKEALKCVRNDNGERFVEFCATNSLVITTTSFPHKGIHNYNPSNLFARTRLV